jgi:hypothetical protein
MVTISATDLPLVQAFIEREARDFGAAPSDFVSLRLEKIEEALAKLDRADRIHFESLGNTGCLIRKLSIDPGEGWDWKKGDVSIIFCMCGKLDHWGTVTQEEK